LMIFFRGAFCCNDVAVVKRETCNRGALVGGQPGTTRKAMAGRLAVLDSIEAGDLEDARRAMRKLLETAPQIQEEFVSGGRRAPKRG